MVRLPGLEPGWSPIRPSNVRVCLFRHNRKYLLDYNITNIFSKFRYYVLEIGKTSYIKRVIGLPGERVQIENGKVFIHGEKLDESYLQEGVVTTSLEGVFTDITVPKNCLFVMGDNRPQSTDSRRFGCIPLEKIESKVWIRFWPFDLFGKVE